MTLLNRYIGRDAAMIIVLVVLVVIKMFRQNNHHHDAFVNGFTVSTFTNGNNILLRSKQPHDVSSFTTTCRHVTKEQQEQLDKYGATPETSIEILFDKMAETPDFMLNVLPKPWKQLMTDMKQMKRDKKDRLERKRKRQEQQRPPNAQKKIETNNLEVEAHDDDNEDENASSSSSSSMLSP